MEAFVLCVRPALCVTGPAVRQSHGLYPARAGFYFSFAAVFSSWNPGTEDEYIIIEAGSEE